MKFGHIGIKVMDMEKSLNFYESVLSANVLKDYHYPDCRLVFVEVGGTVIELIGIKTNTKRTVGPIEHIAFKVEDLNEKIQLLNNLGIPYTKPREVGTARIVFFDGPNNEKFEFVAKI